MYTYIISLFMCRLYTGVAKRWYDHIIGRKGLLKLEFLFVRKIDNNVQPYTL